MPTPSLLRARPSQRPSTVEQGWGGGGGPGGPWRADATGTEFATRIAHRDTDATRIRIVRRTVTAKCWESLAAPWHFCWRVRYPDAGDCGKPIVKVVCPG